MCHARCDGCCRTVVDYNTNFDVNVELRHNRTVNRDRRTNGQTNGKAGTYVAKSGGQGDVSYKV